MAALLRGTGMTIHGGLASLDMELGWREVYLLQTLVTPQSCRKKPWLY